MESLEPGPDGVDPIINFPPPKCLNSSNSPTLLGIYVRKIKKSIEHILKSNRKKKKKRNRPLTNLKTSEEDELRSIVNKAIKKIQGEEDKPKKKKGLEEITIKTKINVKKKKAGVRYNFTIPYESVPEHLDYSKIFTYLGKMKPTLSIYGTYDKEENKIETYNKDDMDFKTIETIMRNKKMGVMFGNYAGDGSYRSPVTVDVGVTQREKWNMMRKFSFNFALSTALYSML